MSHKSIEKEIIFDHLLEWLESNAQNSAAREQNLLDEIFEQIDSGIEPIHIKNNVENIVDMIGVHYYAEGIKMGVHLTKIIGL